MSKNRTETRLDDRVISLFDAGVARESALTWLTTKNSKEAKRRVDDVWFNRGLFNENGVFWAEEIKKHRDHPQKRFDLAVRNLPLPGAYGETAKSIRMVIRAKRKTKQPWEDELTLLHWLASLESFTLPYAARLQQPGFNVMERIPGSVISSWVVNYNDIGYQKLDLLNATDRKWMVELWGEPNNHTTLNIKHQDVWEKYESICIGEQGELSNRLFGTWEEIAAGNSTPSSTTPLRGKLVSVQHGPGRVQNNKPSSPGVWRVLLDGLRSLLGFRRGQSL